MKRIYKFLLMTVVATSTLFYSCETTEMEILASPNELSPDQADADLLLNTVQKAYRSSQITFNDLSGEMSRIDYMFGREYFSNYPGGTLDGPWNNLYSSMIPDIEAMEALNSSDNDLSFHLGIAKAMQAHTMMQLVDFLGDIVWAEANQPNEYPAPNLEDDAGVYAAAEAMLDEAMGYLNNASGAGSATDLYYGGDVSKWKKLVNTLKMRANLTKGNWQAVADATDVIASNADDFEFAYGTQALSPDTRHPDYAEDYTSSGANIYQSNWLMSLMMGSTDEWHDLWANGSNGYWVPGDPVPGDPRRRFYFYRQTWNTPGQGSNLFFSGYSYVYPDEFSSGAGSTADGETLQCSLQSVPGHLQLTPDAATWCGLMNGYWGRMHGNDEGTPPDNFTRTAVGVYPAGGSFDNQPDVPDYAYYGSLSAFPHGAVGLGNGGGGNGIEPIYLASYVDFMKAEANMHLGNHAAAATHLEAGMTKSMTKVISFGSKDSNADTSLFPSSAEITAYVDGMVAEFNAAAASSATDGFGFPVAKDKMDILGEQYFIAMFGGAGDAYNFVRRTGYPRTLSRMIEPNPGTFPRTLLYPSGEVSANSNILQRTDNATKVFWDNGVTNPAN